MSNYIDGVGMDSLSDFVSKDAEIKRLNNQMSMMANFYTDFYDGKIAKLEAKLITKSNQASYYKSIWKMAIGEHELPTDKARKLISRAKKNSSGKTVSLICVEIAKEVGLSISAVRKQWYGL